MALRTHGPGTPATGVLAPPTGPLGRLARVGLAAVGVVSFVSIADQGGPASFQGAPTLTDPSLLFLDAVMVALFVALAGVLASAFGASDPGRWRVASLLAVVVAVCVAATASQLANGSTWGRPLSDLVWWFDALMLLETIVALAIAVMLGLSGCELGVWAILVARLRGQAPPTRPFGCVVGLHLVDQWEARRLSPS
jgi:hypothetical protein